MRFCQLEQAKRLAPALVVLLPLVGYWHNFCDLFWFGDELQLLKEIVTLGFWPSTTEPFAEGIVPFFKILWGALAIASHTNYLPMVLSLWTVHLLTIAVFLALLSNAGFSRFTSTYASLTAGLAWSNIDLLTISYHLNSGLCTLLFLISLKMLIDFQKSGLAARTSLALYFLVLILSILTFQRALVSISSLVVFILVSTFPQRRIALVTTLSALLFQIALLTVPQHQFAATVFSDRQASSRAIEYGIFYFAYNPLLRIFTLAPHLIHSGSYFWTFFLCKCAIFGLGIAIARRKSHSLFAVCLTFIAFDIIHSVVLGISRYTQGIESVSVYRYQFSSLIALTPSAGLVLETFLTRICKSKNALTLLLLSTLSLSLLAVFKPWGRHIRAHALWQGRQGKRILLSEQYPELIKGKRSQDLNWNGVPPTMTQEEAQATLRSLL